MKQFIYADNAATTKLDSDALEAMLPWLQNNYGNASQPYSFSRPVKKALADARAIISECINADPDEIFFTSCGTESDNWAIKGSALADSDRRTTVVTSQVEHHAILHSCAAIERMGYSVRYLPVNEKGIILPETLEQYMTGHVRTVSIMMANNEIGTLQPIKELAEITHKHRAVFHTDAVQAVGHISVDVQDLDVDMLSASAHKFNGPKGIGFLYVKKGIPLVPYIDGGAQETKMRAGTENVAAITGMAVALRNNVSRIDTMTAKLQAVESAFLTHLSQSGVDYIRNGTNHIPGNVNISIKGASGEMLLHRLDLKGICISTGAACDSVNTQVSHVIQAINVPEEYAKGTIRISFGIDNTEDEAIAIADAIIKINNM